MNRSLRRLFVLLMLALAPASLAAQEAATITGRVTNEAGAPVAFATVALEQLGIGAITREDGRYTIVVPGARTLGQSLTLSVRVIGYKQSSAPITLSPGAITQDFSLVANPLQIGEIVVTGAGTATEAQKLGHVRNTVSSDQIQRANEWNMVEALAAKAPNVQVTASSGEPGSGSYITIRGQRTVGLPNTGSSQPLFVVDGVPIDNTSFSTTDFNPTDGLTSGSIEGTTQTNRAGDINPADIESVEILKGAAAAAIYGARAGQGVVLITTKHGQAGPTRYSFHSSLSRDEVNREYPLQRMWGQGSLGSGPGNCDRAAGRGNFNCRTSWGPAIPAGQSFDHANEAYVMGYKADNTLTVSGGTDRTTFYLSTGYLYNRGVFEGPNNDYSRFSVRFNGSHRLSDAFNVAAGITYIDARGRYIERGNNTNGLLLGLLRSPPDWNNQPYLAPNGQHQSFRFKNPLPEDQMEDRGWENPFFVLNVPENVSALGRTIGNIKLEYLPASWMRLNYILGADYSNDERFEGAPQSSTAPQTGGRITEGKVVNYQIDHNLTATAYYRVNPSFSGSVTVGQNLNSRNVRKLANVGRTLVSPEPYKLSNTVTRDIPVDEETVIHSESYFGQATFDLYDQLYLTAAARNDGSSTFDAEHLRAWFPKASVAWEFTKAMGQRPWLSFGKLRGSYGEAGQEPDPYLTSSVYSGSVLIGGYTQGMGNTPTQSGWGGLASSIVKGSESLRPERTREFEAGFDLGLWEERLDFAFTYYNAITSDVILLTPLAPSAGYEREAKNSAKFQNRGVELSLNVRPVRSSSVSWDIGLQWSSNRSKVQSLGGPDFVRLDPNGLTPFGVVKEGEEVGVFYDLGLARCGLSPGGMGAVVAGYDLDPNAAPGPTTPCAGAPHGAYFIDANGEPVTDNTFRVIGNPNPRWTASVRTALRYGKWHLSGLLDVRHGGQMHNGTRAALYAYGTHKDTEVRADCSGDPCVGNERVIGQPGSPIVGPVVGPGAGTPVPIGENWYTGVGGLFGGTPEQFIEDAGFVKLREITLGYTFDEAWVQRVLGFSSVDLRVSGRNLFTWTKYTGYDPETNLGGSVQATRGLDYFNMPQTRSFAFSLTLNR